MIWLNSIALVVGWIVIAAWTGLIVLAVITVGIGRKSEIAYRLDASNPARRREGRP